MEYKDINDRIDETNDRERRARRARRMEEMKRRKDRQRLIRKIGRIAVPVMAGIIVIVVAIGERTGKIGADTDSNTQVKQEGLETSDNGKKAETKKAETKKTGTEKADTAEAETAQAAGTGITGAESGTTNETVAAAAAGSAEGAKAIGEAVSAMKKGQSSYAASATEDTLLLGGDIISNYAILIDMDTDSIVAQKGAKTRINPASMTKVLTLLVAAEHIDKDKLDDTFTITVDITDYSYVNDCSNVGFAKDETVTVRDLLYGTILPSGADAALGLATYVAGSQEAFVELMNEKLAELGLSESARFTNCVGLYDENHYCTVYDMAVIMAAAIDNELCKEVLSAHTYTTSATEQHPEGITVSNWFLRRIEDKDAGGEVLCGKTGYVVQSGNCAVSYGVDKNGKGYICVTADANSGWRCIYDHVALYKQFMA